MTDLYSYLASKTYPGRGIAIGSYNGESVIAYFIMGRSQNSRNRVFKVDGDRMYTDAYDPSKVEDPSLIIYNAIRCLDDLTIVTNGDQTDTIYDFLTNGGTFEQALDTREYEPDAPSYTARISGITDRDGNCMMGILRRKDGVCERSYYTFPAEPGTGHFISTYADDGNPLPAFEGDPIEFRIDCDMEEFGNRIWQSLDHDNKVSLYVRYTGKDGYRDLIFNANEE